MFTNKALSLRGVMVYILKVSCVGGLFFTADMFLGRAFKGRFRLQDHEGSGHEYATDALVA